MQRVILMGAAIVMALSLFAQAPEKMSYQAVVRDASNNLVTSSSVGMQISILQFSPSGTAVYVETQTTVTNSNGLVSIEIGNGTVISGNFSNINWANGPYFLKSETDPTGGTNYSIIGTSQLLSVPYALYAENSGSSIPGPQGPQGPQGDPGPPAIPSNMNYNQNLGVQANITTSGTDVVSVGITTNGGPVMISTYGDAVNTGGPVVARIQLYRDGSPIGNETWVESNGTNENQEFALSVIDFPSAGAHTYALHANYVQSATLFGETDGPVIHAIELIGATGPQGPASTGGFNRYIGEEYGGGVIFHLWKDSQGVEHGLIIDKTDLSVTQAWSNIDQTLIGSSAQSSWDGLSNSNAVTGQSGHSISAAALCINSNNGGQSDWYLPAIDELNLLWQSRFNVNKTLSTISGATTLPISAFYWSSTENDSNNAWNFGFANGVVGSNNKSSTMFVRAVRSF